MYKVKIIDYGLIDYSEAWKIQQGLFKQSLEATQKGEVKNFLLFCEHPHVYTLGKSGDENNLLLNNFQLKTKNATFYKVDRGGDITYHGPGQIVVYPIFNLNSFNIGIKKYIYLLEQSVIDTIQEYGVFSERLDGAIGVWLDVGKKTERKICAIGVKASRYITMHGLAFNINTDLTYFDNINPCGFVDKGVTSLNKEIGYKININEVKKKLKKHIERNFFIKKINLENV